jgi:hypothetical protein
MNKETPSMKSRKTVDISKRLNKRWQDYAAAARATGRLDAQALLARAVPAGAVTLGLLGGGEGALANIIYTPANIMLPVTCTQCSPPSFRSRGSLAIDLNHDGVNDFNLTESRAGNPDFSHSNVWAIALGANGIAKGAEGALAMPKGARIGSGLAFGSAGLMAQRTVYFYSRYPHSRYYFGSWVRVADGFLGLQFQFDGSAHYGWAEFDMINLTLEGYAYDTVAGQSLYAGQTTSAPEPGTLGVLALGSLGLGFWHRKKAIASQQ